MTEAAARPNYKKTLNLPKTSFPMRANLAQNEPQSLKRWDQASLYDTLMNDRADADPFVFHDGPPYANGSIHLGHLMNKVLKDIVVRSRLMAGQRCAYVPGWDCHGLPIEHKVMTELVESGKIDKLAHLDDDTRRMAIRKACRAYAEKYIKLQKGQMQRLMTLGDYANPYLTMNPRYEKAVIEVFAGMVDEGVVYRDLKPVHWSIANQTALAEAELEYETREDLSVYVDFEADDQAAVEQAFGVELDARPSFMIWTTTPWTLPANLAIALHERVRYALVRVDGNVTVLAVDLVEKVTTAAKAEHVEVLAEANGRALLGLGYRHPFCERTGRVVHAEYVTTEDGTGLVHTAPGHGTEDYQTGLREGLDIYCPVQDDGTYDDTVPEWLRGRSVWEANESIADWLRDSGHLFYSHVFSHEYPHDWRSKTPVIFRSTQQWFVGVDRETKRGPAIREAALNAIENDVDFVPAWGRNRLRGMVDSRPDWCLSRQRAWGLPIPTFLRPDGEVFVTGASVRAVAEAFGARGSDAWFTETPAQLLATYDAASDPEAPSDLDIASLEKMHDIFDVWFESGSSWNAVMRARGLGYPADLYLEGSDQHRGWFQLSLLPGLTVTGESPFRTLLTHGFMVDKDGRKMSKSGGNALSVDDVMKDHGADVCRWWVCSLPFENDIKVDISFFDLAGESYRKVRNTLRFLLSNLADFEPCTESNPDGMCVDLAALDPHSIDAYVLHLAQKLSDDVQAAYAGYHFRQVHNLIYDFCNDTLSAFYCTAVKDRLYCDRADSPRRRVTQTVMWDLLELLTRLLAPVLPHTADEAYRALWKDDAERCVHRTTYCTLPAPPINEQWPALIELRHAAQKALEDAKANGIENPLDAEVVLPDPDGAFAPFAADLPDLLGVSRVSFDGSADTVAIRDLQNEPRCERSWKRDGTVRERSDGGMLSDRDADAVGVA